MKAYLHSFFYWLKSGIWRRPANALAGNTDLQKLFIDSTILRAHQHASGAQKNRTAGRITGLDHAAELIAHLPPDTVIGDNGYGTLVERIETFSARAGIPSRPNRRKPRILDHAQQRLRKFVERLFNRLEIFHLVAARYDKLACNFAFSYNSSALFLDNPNLSVQLASLGSSGQTTSMEFRCFAAESPVIDLFFVCVQTIVSERSDARKLRRPVMDRNYFLYTYSAGADAVCKYFMN